APGAYQTPPKPSARETWIERVAHGVAHEVETDDRDEERHAGPEHDPRRLLQVAAPRVDHAAPGRLRRLDTEAEERQRGFREDREGDAERRLHDDRRRRVRDHVAPRDAP